MHASQVKHIVQFADLRKLAYHRAVAVIMTDTAEHWNRVHPNEEPINMELDFGRIKRPRRQRLCMLCA